MISLKSSDGVTFEVELAVALQSHTIRTMFALDDENSAADINLTVPIDVKSNILGKVIEYCKRHAKSSDDDGGSGKDLKSFDSAFVRVDHKTLFSLISAANYLNIRSLIDLTTQTVADMLKGKSSEEMGRILKIVNDFSPDERVRQRLNNLFLDL